MCRGVTDLSPIKDLPISDLDIKGTHVSDLTPIRHMKLTVLDIKDTSITDLGPIEDMETLQRVER